MGSNSLGKYSAEAVEAKWLKVWEAEKPYKALDDSKKPKSYILIEFPYPSGERLHVGHARSYSCLDVVARKRRMQGYNVLYPIGWDAFGLPAENYAIKTGIHPSITTANNIDNARKQAKSWGLSFDWDREVNTTDPGYYKWTQWIFIQLFNKGLAYKAEIPVNWCPSCKINLANEEVLDGKCERCGTQTERRMQKQWLLRITEYADRLLSDLNTVNYRSDIKQQQVNWIGKKEGVNIAYQIEGGGEVVVFTTRPDTNFGATFVVIAPEHSLVDRVIDNPDVALYVAETRKKSELERLAENKEKTGVFTGLYAINNLNGDKLPIWISDFVLAGFGTGAVVGVPGHDKRDFEFAKAMGLPIKRVVVGKDGDMSDILSLDQVQEEEGKMINSGFLDGLEINQAMIEVTKYLEDKGFGKRVSTFHLRDWVFSRQHYWGEPIPMVICDKCGWQPVAESELPVRLPEVEKYLPTDTGESPLATMTEWLKAVCPKCGGSAKRETDTMPNWAGSSWYFLRYIDPNNDKTLGDAKKFDYWLPVDWYNGGMEHTTLHLLYSRFWHKFLFDLGVVPTAEPYAKRTSHGVVLGPDGKRMSKSKGNVINPDEVVKKYGADTLRLYEAFMGPFDQVVAWSWENVEGVNRFLRRVWVNCDEVLESGRMISTPETMHKLSVLLLRIDSDVEEMKFNTAVSAFMEYLNWWQQNKAQVGLDAALVFIKALAPFAPFMSEEIFEHFTGGKKFESVHLQAWPKLEIEGDFEAEVVLAVQINGKLRDKLQMKAREAGDEKLAWQKALEIDRVKNMINGASYRIIFVPGKVINFVLDGAR